MNIDLILNTILFSDLKIKTLIQYNQFTHVRVSLILNGFSIGKEFLLKYEFLKSSTWTIRFNELYSCKTYPLYTTGILVDSTKSKVSQSIWEYL